MARASIVTIIRPPRMPKKSIFRVFIACQNRAGSLYVPPFDRLLW